MYNELELQLLNKYENAGLGCNKICVNCRKQNGLTWLPTTAWFVGSKLKDNPHQVLFVGKSARGNPGNNLATYSNVFDDGRKLWNCSWPYWSYTRTIVQQLFGDDSAEHIALSNIVKCNDSLSGDKTTPSMKQSCIVQNHFVREEIRIIQPTEIVFYTGRGYDEYLCSLFDKFDVIVDKTIPNGKVQIPWLEANAQINGKSMRVLRTAHPQNKNKEDFVNAVCNWVQQ